MTARAVLSLRNATAGVFTALRFPVIPSFGGPDVAAPTRTTYARTYFSQRISIKLVFRYFFIPPSDILLPSPIFARRTISDGSPWPSILRSGKFATSRPASARSFLLKQNIDLIALYRRDDSFRHRALFGIESRRRANTAARTRGVKSGRFFSFSIQPFYVLIVRPTLSSCIYIIPQRAKSRGNCERFMTLPSFATSPITLLRGGGGGARFILPLYLCVFMFLNASYLLFPAVVAEAATRGNLGTRSIDGGTYVRSRHDARFNISILDARNIVYPPGPRARVARSRKYMKNSRPHKDRNLYAMPRYTAALYSAARVSATIVSRARATELWRLEFNKSGFYRRDYRPKCARQLPEAAARVSRKRITKMLPLRRARLIKRNKNVSPGTLSGI